MRELGNEKILSVYSTLPKVRAAQAKTLAKCVPLKVIQLSFRKISEEFGRGKREFLMKKGCKEGGVSL